MRTKLYTFLVLPLAATALLGDPCSPVQKGAKLPQSGDLVYEVSVIQPRLEAIPRIVSATGTFTASDRITMKSHLIGNVERVFVGVGDNVQVGDPLCVIDAQGLKVELETKQAELKEAEAELEELRRNLEITGGVLPGSPASELLFLDDEIEAPPVPEKINEALTVPSDNRTNLMDNSTSTKVIEAHIERLTKELDALDQKILGLTIKAPLAGIISQLDITEGSRVIEQDPLLTIVNLNPVSISFVIPAEISSYVDKLVKVTAAPQSAPEKSREGTVFFISPSIDEASRSLEMRAHLPNNDLAIREGQEGLVTVATRKIDKRLIVPKSVLVKADGQYIAYVVSGTQVEKTPVTILKEMENRDVAIEARLRIDDLIAMDHLDKLKDGSFVKVLLKQIAQPSLDKAQ